MLPDPTILQALPANARHRMVRSAVAHVLNWGADVLSDEPDCADALRRRSQTWEAAAHQGPPRDQPSPRHPLKLVQQ